MQILARPGRVVPAALLVLSLVGLEARASAQLEPTPVDALPFEITAPGHYRVTQDLSIAPGGEGITINASGVELDLGGFTISGGGSGSAVSSGHSRVTVRNGRILDWDGAGVFLTTDGRVEDVVVFNVTYEGIRLGARGIVRRCSVTNTGAAGIDGVNSFLVEGCTVDRSGGDGIHLNSGIVRDSTVLKAGQVEADASGIEIFSDGRVEGCTVSEAAAIGIEGPTELHVERCSVETSGSSGIRIGSGAVVDCRVLGASQTDPLSAAIEVVQGGLIERCTVRDGLGDGAMPGPSGIVRGTRVQGVARSSIALPPGALAEDVTVRDFGAKGIQMSAGASVRGAVVNTGTGRGIQCLTNGRVSDAMVDAAGEHGVWLEDGATLERSTVARSTLAGVWCDGDFATVVDCRVVRGLADGIRLESGSSVRRCTLASNAGDGLVADGDGNPVEGNHASANERGIVFTGSDNLSVGNVTFANGTDFAMPFTNTMGPVLKNQSWIQSSNPWANFDLDFF